VFDLSAPAIKIAVRKTGKASAHLYLLGLFGKDLLIESITDFIFPPLSGVIWHGFGPFMAQTAVAQIDGFTANGHTTT
jgi:hypothetical protein